MAHEDQQLQTLRITDGPNLLHLEHSLRSRFLNPESEFRVDFVVELEKLAPRKVLSVLVKALGFVKSDFAWLLLELPRFTKSRSSEPHALSRQSVDGWYSVQEREGLLKAMQFRIDVRDLGLDTHDVRRHR